MAARTSPHTFFSFWHGGELSPVAWACLSSFVECGHRLVLYGYERIPVPDGVEFEDARAVLPAQELFSFQGSFSAFSNVFRYTRLLADEGWWVDADVFCLAREIPACRYAWAHESPDFINGAILRLPPGDSTLIHILDSARSIGSHVDHQGQLGPRLLTQHLTGFTKEVFGSTSQFYPLHWVEAYRFWAPSGANAVLAQMHDACFVHLWATMFRYMGVSEQLTPPGGSFLEWVYAGRVPPRRLASLDAQALEQTTASVREYLARDHVREASREVLGYDVAELTTWPGRSEPHAAAPVGDGPAVAVVIPVYNMAWSLERALRSCWTQSVPPRRVVIVDDGSTDQSGVLARDLAARDARVEYLRLAQNRGHLGALRHGLQHIDADWVVLLDADDELTPTSIATRLAAAARYRERHGEWPALVYGDLYRNRPAPETRTAFKQIEGLGDDFLCRELSLCQTSTIMLGRAAVPHFPLIDNAYNTDDEIVVAVSQYGTLMHAGEPVAIVYDHESPKRMSNNARARFRGVAALVSHHRDAIARRHGWRQLWLWRLRIARAWLEWQVERADRRLSSREPNRLVRGRWQLCRWLAHRAHGRLSAWLTPRFEQMYF